MITVELVCCVSKSGIGEIYLMTTLRISFVHGSLKSVLYMTVLQNGVLMKFIC